MEDGIRLEGPGAFSRQTGGTEMLAVIVARSGISHRSGTFSDEEHCENGSNGISLNSSRPPLSSSLSITKEAGVLLLYRSGIFFLK